MKIVKRLGGNGASEQDLNRLETIIGSKLPVDYRQFLGRFNGGRPEPSGFVFDTVDGKSDSSVRYFLTLDEHEDHYTIQEFIDLYSDRLPPKVLPIACDSFGNLVLLDIGAKAAGEVCFWDHEKESMDEPTWDNISIVAHSFSEFLDMLS